MIRFEQFFRIQTFVIGTVFFFLSTAQAQLVKKRAQVDAPVSAIFKATKIITLGSVKNYDAKTLNFSIMHSFGLVRTGPEELWGLDGSANIRFSLDYGITRKFSVGLGRSRVDKVYDLRVKYTLLEQMLSDKIPVKVVYQFLGGINTLERPFLSEYDFEDRLNYSHSLAITRKFNSDLSLQITPILVHFNRVAIGDDNTLFALGLGGRYRFSKRAALTFEYIPILSGRPENLNNDPSGNSVRAKDNFSLGVDIETAGHVFQLFFTSAFGLTEQYAIARNRTDFSQTDPIGNFRIGFNVNRIFLFKSKKP